MDKKLKTNIEEAKRIVKDVRSEYREAAFTAVLTRLLLRDVEKIVEKPKARHPKAKRIMLPEKIIELRNKKFFSDPKTITETQQELKTYPLDQVKVALLRIWRKRELRRFKEKRDKKEILVYVYP